MPWHTTGPLCPNTLLVHYALTYYWSIIPWHTTGPICPNTLLVAYAITHNYWFIIPWHITCLLLTDILLVPNAMPHYWHFFLWHTTGLLWPDISFLFPDTLLVHYALTYYKSLIPWYTTGPTCHDTLSIPQSLTVHTCSSYHDILGPLFCNMLLVHYSLTYYWSIISWYTKYIIWQTTCFAYL